MQCLVHPLPAPGSRLPAHTDIYLYWRITVAVGHDCLFRAFCRRLDHFGLASELSLGGSSLLRSWIIFRFQCIEHVDTTLSFLRFGNASVVQKVIFIVAVERCLAISKVTFISIIIVSVVQCSVIDFLQMETIYFRNFCHGLDERGVGRSRIIVSAAYLCSCST